MYSQFQRAFIHKYNYYVFDDMKLVTNNKNVYRYTCKIYIF